MIDPLTAPLFDVAMEILRTIRLEPPTERALHDVTVDHCHVWGEFYGPASSPGLARVIAHRFLDRQGCDETHLREALARFGGEQPPIAADREAELSRMRWRQLRPFVTKPADGEVLVARCVRCGGWTMMHGDPESPNWTSWGLAAQKDGDLVALELYTGSLGPGCGDAELKPARRTCARIATVPDSAAPNASPTSDSDAK